MLTTTISVRLALLVGCQMIRATKHTLKFANNGKRSSIETLLAEWRRVMQLISDDMWLNGYRSQRCSGCGHVLKKARKGKLYVCPLCGLTMDADINAAKNHETELPVIPHSSEFSKLANSEGFFWLPDGLFRMDGSVLRVPNTEKSQ